MDANGELYREGLVRAFAHRLMAPGCTQIRQVGSMGPLGVPPVPAHSLHAIERQVASGWEGRFVVITSGLSRAPLGEGELRHLELVARVGANAMNSISYAQDRNAARDKNCHW